MKFLSRPLGLADLESGLTHPGFQSTPSLSLQFVSGHKILNAAADETRKGRPPPRGDNAGFDDEFLVERQCQVSLPDHASHNT
jgi:hypothetical protein